MNKQQKSFDRNKKPPRQNTFFLPFIWLWCFAIARFRRLKVKKVGMEGIKPPYLVFSTHHGFIDFYVAPVVLFPHRANYISELEGFIGREWWYRQVGCLCKRKFTYDLALIRNIRHVVHTNRDIMVIYPEARYCNVGTNSKLTDSVGKLVKHLGIPVVVLNMRGNYLLAPIWNLRKRYVPLEADLTLVLNAEEVKELDVPGINERISEAFQYDDYAYQWERKIPVKYKRRAEGIHKALYQCPSCLAEYVTETEGSKIRCTGCGKEWEMTVYGRLAAAGGETEFEHIPDWYEFQRKQTEKEIDNGAYVSEAPVKIEALPNSKGFVVLGEGYVVHDLSGFRLRFTEDGEEKVLEFPPAAMSSIHTEYDYRKKGECITLSTLDNTYFLYPLTKRFNVTKVQFATEYLYRLAVGKV